MRFVVLLGVVSLFADVTYEGARSVLGPFFESLGASAAVVGTVAGAGELAGYGLRLFSGYLADRTRAYWGLTILGYAVNLLAVPLLALSGHWIPAAALVILERAGKAVRTPARDVMLSHATHEMGRGWGFGLHEALDQIGAVAGPLVVAAVLARTHRFGAAFLILAIPAALSIGSLIFARFQFPDPSRLEPPRAALEAHGWRPAFWWYVAGSGLLAAGFVDFPLISYHLEKHRILATDSIPILYASAMGVQAVAALVFGKLYDRLGTWMLPASIAVSALSLPFSFSYGWAGVVLGMACWGVGMGAQSAILRAGVAELTGPERRGSAYGVFNTAFGVAWFAGSAVMGKLYDISEPALVWFGLACQAASAALFLALAFQKPNDR